MGISRKELMKKYIQENFPKKPYKKTFILRQRRKNEIFLSEILIALFIIFMMVTLFLNAIHVEKYQLNLTNSTLDEKIDINITIEPKPQEKPQGKIQDKTERKK